MLNLKQLEPEDAQTPDGTTAAWVMYEPKKLHTKPINQKLEIQSHTTAAQLFWQPGERG
jgi:hypothetical protein